MSVIAIDRNNIKYEADSVKALMELVGIEYSDNRRRCLARTLQRNQFCYGYKIIQNSNSKFGKSEEISKEEQNHIDFKHDYNYATKGALEILVMNQELIPKGTSVVDVKAHYTSEIANCVEINEDRSSKPVREWRARTGNETELSIKYRDAEGNIKFTNAVTDFESGGFINPEFHFPNVEEYKLDESRYSKVEEDEENNTDESVLKENRLLRKQVQTLRDKLRILRAEDRKGFRQEEIKEEFLNELRNIIPIYRDERTIPKIYRTDNKTAILQISDVHIGKTIDLQTNKFNPKIARERLFKYIDKTIIEYLMPLGIVDIDLCFTGDLINLSHRESQKLTNSNVRAEMTLIAFDIFSDIIEYLLNSGYNLNLSSVLGNESRFAQHVPQECDNRIALDNFDYLIFQMLKRRFEKVVNFKNEGDQLDSMIEINGKNIILVHGDMLQQSKLKESVKNLKLRKYEDTGKFADFILLGHIHEAIIQNDLGRSASICGEDSYSNNKLNIPRSYISQNLYIVGEDIQGIIVKCR